MVYENWFESIFDVLQADDEACLGMIRSAGGRSASVSLVEGDVEMGEALTYARTLCEIGRVVEARDVLFQVLHGAFGMPAQGAQY